MSGYEVRSASIGSMIVSKSSKTTQTTWILDDNTAPPELEVSRAPVNTVWKKATPAIGDTTFFQKAEDGTLGEGGALS